MLDVLNTVTPPSDLRIALSGITGSISFACWIVLLIPQLIEQWKLKSAAGLSFGTVLIWVGGDLCNLIGAVWAKLLPPVILLAVWFLIIDGSLLVSYTYYTYIFPKRHNKLLHIRINDEESEEVTVTEISNLLPNENHSTTRRNSVKSRRDSLTSLVIASNHWSVFKKYVLPVLFVSFAGVIGYLFSSPAPSSPDGELPSIPDDAPLTLGPQIFGYLSASCYLGARIPQIFYNHQRKSCHGLSLLFILFSTFGNITYSLQILFFRNDWDYVLLNLSWLIGSLGAVFEDAIIYFQFIIYKNNNNENEFVEVIEEENEV